MFNLTTKEIDKKYIASTYARFPLEIVKGKGSIVYDENGKKYIDLGSGIAVNTFGLCDEVWQNAIDEQMKKIQHMSNLYYTKPCADLAEMLCKKTGMKKVFFSNSGAEANECAIKAARRYSFKKYGDESHSNIITLKNSFHGRTITTLTATGQDSFHTDFGPFPKGFLYADANDIDSIKDILQENHCCAIMIEVVQGEGGVNKLDDSYVKAVRKIADENDLFFIVDEVQTGNGRTGKLFGYMNYDIVPDIVTTAKGLGGGLPIGATLFSEKAENIFEYGTHGSTFGGNPICCAGALSILERIDDELLSGVLEKSNYIFDELSNAAGVKSVSGMGLMIGIEIEKDLKEVVKTCMEKGLLVLTAKTKLRLLPALNIPFNVLKQAMEILKDVLK